MDYFRLIIAISLQSLISLCTYAMDIDSIGIKAEVTGVYVLHQVDAQETLYALSRRYNTSIASILESNDIIDKQLSEGSIVRIPWQYGLKHKVSRGETLYSLSKHYQVPIESIKNLNGLNSSDVAVGTSLIILPAADLGQSVEQADLPNVLHVVETKETLFSIAKKYKIELEQLKQWNRLSGDNVQVGDTLVLTGSGTSDEPLQNLSAVVFVNSQSAEPPEQSVVPQKNSSLGSSNDILPIRESGIAAVIDGNPETKKYLALHATAPVGTIMRVRNEMTNLSVFVRVVGKLPNTGSNNNLVIRLSEAAQEALGALDSKFRVELSYVPNQ